MSPSSSDFYNFKKKSFFFFGRFLIAAVDLNIFFKACPVVDWKILGGRILDTKY